MLDDDKQPFLVTQEEDRFKVQDESGRALVICRDPGSAHQYAVLMNEAYRRGYKSGYRDARKP